MFRSVGCSPYFVVMYLIAARPRGTRGRGGRGVGASDRKERLLSDIRELDMDLVTGKLDEEDHRRLRAVRGRRCRR
jgi:hypothetical protein